MGAIALLVLSFGINAAHAQDSNRFGVNDTELRELSTMQRGMLVGEMWFVFAYPTRDGLVWDDIDPARYPRLSMGDPKAILDREGLVIGVECGASEERIPGLTSKEQEDQSGARCEAMKAWLTSQFAGFNNPPTIFISPNRSLGKAKAEAYIYLPTAAPPPPQIIPEPCHVGGRPYTAMFPVDLSTNPPRNVAGDRNTDGVYDAQDCPVLQDIPVARKLRWELHGNVGVSVSALDLRVGAGFFLPVNDGGWLRFWADVGITPDRSSVTGDPTAFDLMQMGFGHPVATWGVGGTWIGAKGLTIGGTGEGFRMTTDGFSDAYDVRAFAGYTGFLGNHGFWYAGGGLGLNYGYAPRGESVWNYGNWVAGGTQYWGLALGAEAGIGGVF